MARNPEQFRYYEPPGTVYAVPILFVDFMQTLYEKNGLIFWDHEAIRIRRCCEHYFVMKLESNLKQQNRAFELIQIEAPLLTPRKFINKQYTDDDVWTTSDDLVLCPETTMGSYAYANYLLTNHKKIRLPIVVWQHGKSFRREQDQVTKNMRLKEFYQLEFQCMYATTTANDYSISLVPAVCSMISDMIGICKIEPSDRIPDYAEWTKDVICDGMEVCSMSLRKDCEFAKVLEVAIGTDRCVYQFLKKNGTL